jgi:vacuolar iron transporter family protein
MSDYKESIRLQKKFFALEALHYKLYSKLAEHEAHKKHKATLLELAQKEKEHMELWHSILLKKGVRPSFSIINSLKYTLFLLIVNIFGSPFATKYLQNDENEALHAYIHTAKAGSFNKHEAKVLNEVINHEQEEEDELVNKVSEFDSEFTHIKSIVFGLNDGLVEILAAVVGLAVIATSGFVVVIGGIIIGLSGTLSMTGGAYLSSKSEGLVDQSKNETSGQKVTPRKDAFYTGVYYFIGAVIPILPFAFGLSGMYGIALSIILVVVALTIASIVIAILSGTSVSKRIFEMLAISLGASFATMLLGYILKAYFGVQI